MPKICKFSQFQTKSGLIEIQYTDNRSKIQEKIGFSKFQSRTATDNRHVFAISSNISAGFQIHDPKKLTFFAENDQLQVAIRKRYFAECVLYTCSLLCKSDIVLAEDTLGDVPLLDLDLHLHLHLHLSQSVSVGISLSLSLSLRKFSTPR